jgi:hypothetical protein
VIVNAGVATVGGDATSDVAREKTDWEANELVAVTRILTFFPILGVVSFNVLAVAPLIAVHAPNSSSFSHRNHWYEKVGAGDPVQSPFEVVIV